MFKKKQKKVEEPAEEVEAVEPEPTPEPEEPKFDEAASLEARRQELTEIRESMTENGIDSISKLDQLLSQLNQRLAQLGR